MVQARIGKMNSKQAWYIFGAGVVYYYFLRGARALRFGIKNFGLVSFTDSNATFEIRFYIYNPLLVDIFCRTVSGDIRLMGVKVGEIDYPINQTIQARSLNYVPVQFTVSIADLTEGLWQYIQTGNVSTLIIEFDGQVVVGRDKQVTVPIRKTVTWGDLVGG